MEEQFESYRNHLLAVAYRMLGSWAEAEDSVQEAWLRLHRSDRSQIDNLGGWLTTVVSRICLDMLRSRKARREDFMDEPLLTNVEDRANPEQETLMADSVGVALLVVLSKLNPSERIAFVLHDIFAMPFSELAPIVGKSELATRKLASRARHKVRGKEELAQDDLGRQRKLVDAFLAAAHEGSFEALVMALDPEVVLRDDREAGTITETRGAIALASKVAGRAKSAQVTLVNGSIGAIAASGGKLLYVIQFKICSGKISEIELISSVSRIERLHISMLQN